MESRKEKKEKRRQAILFAALDLFVMRGYSSTKISDIAEQVNMSMGLLFHYFSSKEELYRELVTMGLQGTKFPVEQKYEHAIDFFSVFTGQLFMYLKMQPDNAKFFLLMAQAQKSDATPADIKEIALQVNTIEQFAKLVSWGQAEGTIRQGDPLALSSAYWCSIQGIVENFIFHPEVPLPEAEWIIDMVRPHDLNQ